MSNVAQLLGKERHFDLILCVETWRKVVDQRSYLLQLRDLLSQSDERDEAPNVQRDQLWRRQRLVIADLFEQNDEPNMRALLSSFFEVDDVIDISVNVQKSIIKQQDRRQNFLAASSHPEIVSAVLSQLNNQFSHRCRPSS